MSIKCRQVSKLFCAFDDDSKILHNLPLRKDILLKRRIKLRKSKLYSLAVKYPPNRARVLFFFFFVQHSVTLHSSVQISSETANWTGIFLHGPNVMARMFGNIRTK